MSTVGIRATWRCHRCGKQATTYTMSHAGLPTTIDPPAGWRIINKQSYCGGPHPIEENHPAGELEAIGSYMMRRRTA